MNETNLGAMDSNEPMFEHWAIFLSNDIDRQLLLHNLSKENSIPFFQHLANRKGVIFSVETLNELMEDEERHGAFVANTSFHRSMKLLSSGEQRKLLLTYLLAQHPDYIILDNPYDNLDTASQVELKTSLLALSAGVSVIQMFSRQQDLLPFITNIIIANRHGFTVTTSASFISTIPSKSKHDNYSLCIPSPLNRFEIEGSELVRFTNVDVQYEDRQIVKHINWTIDKGEFWQLVGPNGSGKTTLLTMITGDNPKAFGKDLRLFGKRKGSGESVWEIKRLIGYLTPQMTSLFATLQTVEQLVVSGFLDSVGLYKQPSDAQLRIANEWIALIGLSAVRHKPFSKLTKGQQRMVLIARAMIKHPPLLILDEILTSLDDENAGTVIQLINQIAAATATTILLVSHRTETGLVPNKIFKLTPTDNGSVGMVIQ